MFFNTELFPFFFSHHRWTCRGRRYWSVCGFWKQEDYGNLRYSGKIPAQSQAAFDRTLHTSGYSIGTMIRNILTWFFFLSNHVTCRIHRENHSLRSKRYYSPLLRRPLAGWIVFFFGFTHRPQSPCTDTGPPLHKRSVFLSHSLLFYPLYSGCLACLTELAVKEVFDSTTVPLWFSVYLVLIRHNTLARYRRSCLLRSCQISVTGMETWIQLHDEEYCRAFMLTNEKDSRSAFLNNKKWYNRPRSFHRQ